MSGARAIARTPLWRLIWMNRAECRHCPDLFLDPELVDQAMAVCSTCPVFDECRELVDRLEGQDSSNHFALVWAGEMPHERWARRRHQNATSVERGH